jgi:S-formylglutathione hydrolase FrmB
MEGTQSYEYAKYTADTIETIQYAGSATELVDIVDFDKLTEAMRTDDAGDYSYDGWADMLGVHIDWLGGDYDIVGVKMYSMRI